MRALLAFGKKAGFARGLLDFSAAVIDNNFMPTYSRVAALTLAVFLVLVAALSMSSSSTSSAQAKVVMPHGIDTSSKKVMSQRAVIPKKGYYQIRVQLQLKTSSTGELSSAVFDINGGSSRRMAVASTKAGTCQQSAYKKSYKCYVVRTPTLRSPAKKGRALFTFLLCPKKAGCLEHKIWMYYR